MSCYFAPLIRMARNIRHIRARAQPVPALSLVTEQRCILLLHLRS